jgi:hypothetical protein
MTKTTERYATVYEAFVGFTGTSIQRIHDQLHCCVVIAYLSNHFLVFLRQDHQAFSVTCDHQALQLTRTWYTSKEVIQLCKKAQGTPS